MSDKTKGKAGAVEFRENARELTDWRDVVTILAVTRGKTAILPEGYPLRSAGFDRKGAHLIVEAELFPKVVVPRFFDSGGPTKIAVENGIEISRHLILLMINLSSRVAFALNLLVESSGD
jgi:hypothetical protein